jgi:hypothetical protein
METTTTMAMFKDTTTSISAYMEYVNSKASNLMASRPRTLQVGNDITYLTEIAKVHHLISHELMINLMDISESTWRRAVTEVRQSDDARAIDLRGELSFTTHTVRTVPEYDRHDCTECITVLYAYLNEHKLKQLDEFRVLQKLERI